MEEVFTEACKVVKKYLADPVGMSGVYINRVTKQ
jgi:hypothetical protein